MKRIIDGVTYNTDTSTVLAKSSYGTTYNHQECQCEGTLYQTRGGAFFVHEVIDLGTGIDFDRIWQDRFKALSKQEAHDWIMTGEVEIIHNPFDDPPEAKAESEPSATIYIRVPASLKQRLEQAAKAESLSGNSWSIRCIERCLASDDKIRADIGSVWWLADMISTSGDKGYSFESVRNMGREIKSLIEKNWKALGLAEDRFQDDIASLAASEDFESLSRDYPREGE